MGRKGFIANPFQQFHIPEQMDEEKLHHFVQLLRAGTITRDQLHSIYFGHMRLGVAIACRIGSSVPHLIPDLVSEAMLALLEGIQRAATALTDNNITPYLSVTMKGRIIDFIENQHIMSSRTYRKKKKESNFTGPYIDLLSKAHERIGVYQHHLNEILEQIDSIVKEDHNLKRREYKRAIVRLKASGYSTEEVASILVMSIRTVETMVKEVRDRYFQMD